MIRPKDLNRFTIKLKILSPISLSPRESYCFYKGIDFEKEDVKKFYPNMKKEVNIIYPFYQYGEYEYFDPCNADYYIPGSSIKGVLGYEDIYVDDVVINQGYLDLKVVNKLQYAKNDEESNKITQFKPFFDKVAIEMLKPGIPLEVTVYAENEKIIDDLLKECKERTKKQLEKADEIIGSLIGRAKIKKEEARKRNDDQNVEDWKRAIEDLECFQTKLKTFEGEVTIFLGGYKGEIFSRKNADSIIADDYQGTFYRDDATGLPFGLVEVTFK